MVVGVTFTYKRLYLVSIRTTDHCHVMGHGDFVYTDIAALQKHKFLLRYMNLVYYRLVVTTVKGAVLCILSESEIAH